MDVIKISNLTKDYGNNKGIFSVNMTASEGECFGFLGPNGAGKTTTIRHLLGLIKADSGDCSTFGLDCFNDAPIIARDIGVVAGEISLFDDMTGGEYLDFVAHLRGLSDFAFKDELINIFELDTTVKIKKMSKGMKQKVALISAFMSRPKLLILDEPTSGLDPLMQEKFTEIILRFKKDGATILMSSHSFDEVLKTCDRVAIIKSGKIIDTLDISSLSNQNKKRFDVSFKNEEDANTFSSAINFDAKVSKATVSVTINGDVTPLITALNGYQVTNLISHTMGLEEYFMHYYGGESND